MTRVVALLSAGLALSLAWPIEHVRACSNILCGGPPRTVPPDGATDVPIDAELEILSNPDFRPTLPGDLTPQLRVAGSDELLALEPNPVTGRMHAAAGLSADTSYELLGPRLDPGCGALETIVLATFTTGTRHDTTPPAAPSVAVEPCFVDTCNRGGCCGPFVGGAARATWPATDDTPFGLVYAFGAPDGPRLSRSQGLWTTVMGGTGLLPTHQPVPGRGPVYAVDVSGNVSEGVMLPEPDLSCAPAPNEICDGGVCADAGAPDAGGRAGLDASHDDASTGAHGGSCGCSIDTRSSAFAPGLALLVLSAVGARRRRHRRR